MFSQRWQQYQARVEQQLAIRLPDRHDEQVPEGSARLNEAMHYACLQGGKRFRAILVYACGDMLGASISALDAIATAIEMLHAYSLVHDDLPAMDNDDLRRGKPTCHKQYDEATAILVGDALQAQAFYVLSQPLPIDSARQLEIIQTFAKAVGASGMCAGQALDMQATGLTVDFSALQQIHRLKTGALIQSAAVMAGLSAPKTTDKQLDLLARYGQKLGLCFQIVDDILDATASSEEMGKTAKKDENTDKITYVSELGIAAAGQHAQKTMQEAIETAQELSDNSQFLQYLAKFVVNRKF